jgi:hypothetical protein
VSYAGVDDCLNPGFRVAQSGLRTWIGGHGTEPYEQNAQQSPAFGFRRTPQPLQS